MNGSILKEKLQLIDIQFVELSKKLNISPQSLNSRLKTKDVTVSFLIELCEAIKKSPYYFLKGTEYEKYFVSEENTMRGETKEEKPNELLETKNELIQLLKQENQRLKDEVAELKGQDKSRTA